MKMIATPTPVTAEQYTAYVHNCLRNPSCEPSYLAPIPGVPYLQLYVDFGDTKPVMTEFQLLDVCGSNGDQIVPSNFVVGKTPEGNWYGVFKYFNSLPDPITGFVVWLSAMVDSPAGLIEKTFFSQAMMIDPCQPITKIKSCHPEGATSTGFDVNGVYYGLPVNLDYLGIAEVRFFHIAYVRQGKVRELSNKATFKSSLYRNFRTTVEKIHQVETELVPKWYKDELLAIYARGAISVNDGPAYLVSDLNFEAINDDDLTWKPFAQLRETFRLYFGCDDSACIECCSPIVLGAFSSTDGQDSGGDEELCDPMGGCYLIDGDLQWDGLYWDLQFAFEKVCPGEIDGYEVAVVEAGQDTEPTGPTFPYIVAPTTFVPPESQHTFEDLQCGPYDIWVRILCPEPGPWRLIKTIDCSEHPPGG